jgi:TATA-box binding protein (TBP) (component of TFIID and TFIIIB)
MKYKIRNVKISVKSTPISLHRVLLLSGKVEYVKDCKNFVVMTDTYSYTIFKTVKLENHINITKIPNLEKVQDAIQQLKKHFKFCAKLIRVDNIMTTLDIKRPIDLISVCEKKLFENIKYNYEVFPGLTVEFEKGSARFFHSGKIVILGVKNIIDLKCLIQNICAVMNTL